MNNENTTVPEEEQKEETEEKQDDEQSQHEATESININTPSQTASQSASEIFVEDNNNSFTSHLPQIDTEHTNNTSLLNTNNHNNIPLTIPSPSATPTNSLSNTPNISSTNINNSNNNSPIPLLPILNTNGHHNNNNHNHNHNHNQNGINRILNGHNNNNNNNNNITSPLIETPERLNELIDTFGHPHSISDFNIMAIAGVLQKGNHIHKNRELKATIKRFRSQMAEQQNQIKTLNEKVKIYKSEAEKYERLDIEYQKVKELNKNLISHVNNTKKDNVKLKERLKNQQLTSMSLSQLHTNTNNGSFHGILPPQTNNNNNHNNNNNNNDDEMDDIAPLPANNHNNNNNDILAPNHMDIDNDNDNDNDDNIEPLQLENDGEKEGEARHPSSWLRNQRLIQLTGDQTYMTAHQKVIRDPNQKKSHQTYQRKDTFKSIQSENKSLKDQIVKLTKDLEEARANHGGLTVDGQTAEYWKNQLSKVRDELEEQKKITTKFNAAMNSNDDPETLKIKHANLWSEHERLKIRYEKSKERVEKLAAETEQAKKDKDKALKDKEETKEKTTKMIQSTKAHIVKISNEKETYRKEFVRFQKENKKLMQRESEEEELKKKLEDLEKKVSHTEHQCVKYKKRYKDLKVQIDTADVSVVIRNRKDRPRGRPKKNEKSIYVSTDSSEAEQLKQTVDFLKKLSDHDDDGGNNNNHNDKNKHKKKKKNKKKRKKHHKKDKKKKKMDKYKDNNNHHNKNQEQQQQQIQIQQEQQQQPGQEQIGNQFKNNNALDDNDDDIDWSDDDDEEPIISQKGNNVNIGAEINRNSNNMQNDNNVSLRPPTIPESPAAAPETTGMSTTIGLMSYGSTSPQMLPIQDITDKPIKPELDQHDFFSNNAHNTPSTTTSIKKSNNSNNTENHNNNNNITYNFDNTANNNNTNNFDNNYIDNNEFDNMFDDTFDNTFDNNFQTDNNNDIDNNNDGDDEDDTSDFFDPDAIYQHPTNINNRDIIQEPEGINDDDDDDEDDEDDDEENSMFDMGSGISSGPSSPCQKPIPLKLSHPVPFSLATTDPMELKQNNIDNIDNIDNRNNNNMAAAPLILHDSGHSAADDSEVPNEQLLNPRNNEIDDGKPQPLFQSFDTMTSDSDDHSDRSNQFQSPLQAQPEPFTALQIENDDENIEKIQDNDDCNDDCNDSEDDDIIIPQKQEQKQETTINFNIGVKKDEDMNNNNNNNNDNDNDISTNNKKRPREIHDNMASNMVINQPLLKKRKLDNNNGGAVDIDNFDDFENFMAANDNTSNINNITIAAPSSTSTAPPLMSTVAGNENNDNIKNELNLPNVSYRDYEQRKIERGKGNIMNMNKPLTMSKDYISTQFVDWKAEFGYIITQKSDELQGSDLVSSCIHSILCRWKYPCSQCDARNTAKQIADGIIQIIMMDKFDILCPNQDFFKSHNKNIYLPFIGALCDIITRLNRCKNSGKNLHFEVMKLCKKIINGKLYREIVDNMNNNIISPKIYFSAGMFAILCKVNKNDPFFWREITRMMEDFELHSCSDIFSIMFECYPKQISSYKDFFVMNCFKHIFITHAHSMNNINQECNEYNMIRECYRRLMNVVNGKWNYILNNPIDTIIKTQMNKTISNGAMDDDINGDTESGILMICGSDIRYGINYFLPSILYPMIYEQFKYHKPKLQIFFLDLYFEAINKIYKQLKKFNESQCELVRNEIVLIMESILTLFIGSVGSSIVGAVEPIVAVCCIRNLFIIKSNNYIQSIIHQNINSDQQLLQFATNIFEAWMTRLNSIKISIAQKQREQSRFNTLMNITQNVFKQKSYNIEAYNSLKSNYSNINNINSNNRQF